MALVFPNRQAEAQAFLAGKPYVTRDDVRTLRTIR